MTPLQSLHHLQHSPFPCHRERTGPKSLISNWLRTHQVWEHQGLLLQSPSHCKIIINCGNTIIIFMTWGERREEWRSRGCMNEWLHGRWDAWKQKPRRKTNKKLSIFSFFVFFPPQINKECSAETGMEGETLRNREKMAEMRRREWERQKKNNSSISSCYVCVWAPPSGRPSEPPALTCQPESEHSCVEGDTEKGEVTTVCAKNTRSVSSRETLGLFITLSLSQRLFLCWLEASLSQRMHTANMKH